MEQKFIHDKLLVKMVESDGRNDKSLDEYPEELRNIVVDYMNYVLPIIYSPKNSPDDFWNRTSLMDCKGLDGWVHVGQHIETKEICYIIYFDSDEYKFEGELFVTEDMKRFFFTDWGENNDRTNEIDKILNIM